MSQKTHIIEQLKAKQGEWIAMPALRSYKKDNWQMGRISSFTARISEGRKIVASEGLYIYESEIMRKWQKHTFYKIDKIGVKQDKPVVQESTFLWRFKNFLRFDSF